ncbi:MAG: hypothetical protein M1819_001057 [Sarea resinae]|nr:MAG: hypothetical protein M1819_001057 [Sarea resinae]
MAPSLPKTFKAARFLEAGAPLTIVDVPLVQPSTGEVLVKVLATGVCYSDVHAQHGSMGSGFPRTPGHETIGDVVAVGEGEKKWKVGDRVGAPWHGGHDGTCKKCQKGLFQMCDNETVNGIFRDGGYAEYVLLRSEATVRVPTSVDPAAYAPILCAGVTVFNSIRHMHVMPGEIVAVQGVGGLGHLAVQYAANMGYRVVALSRGSDKEKEAKEFGASEYIDQSKEDATEKLQSMGGAALIISTAPNPKVISPLLGGLGAEGKLLILAPCGEVPINTFAIIPKGISVHGWPSGHANDCEEAIAFTQANGVHTIVNKFPLADAQKAFENTVAGKAKFRNVLVIG